MSWVAASSTVAKPDDLLEEPERSVGAQIGWAAGLLRRGQPWATHGVASKPGPQRKWQLESLGLPRATATKANFPSGGGDMGAAIRAYDWSRSSLGIPETWPAPLRVSVNLMLSARDPSWVAWGPDLVLLYNDAYRDRLAGKHPAALGQRLVDVWAEIWPEVSPLLARALAGDAVSLEDLQLRVEQGPGREDRYFNVAYMPLHDDNGIVCGIFCRKFDTTNKVVAKRRHDAIEKALLQANTSLEQQIQEQTCERDRLWDLSQDPLLISDLDGQWLHVSAAWTRILGWTEAELINRTSEWMQHPADRARNVAERSSIADGAISTGYENRFRARDGSYRWFSWTAVPADGNRIFCVARDVTEAKAQAEAQAKLEETLRQSQKMEAVGQLTGGLAHDFNNLLTGITGNLEVLEIRLAQNRFGEVGRYVDAAKNAAHRAAALTHRLLAFSRRQTLDSKSTDMDQLVTSMAELIGRTLGPSIEVEVASNSELWPTLVDPSQLENALLNLCINARDAMPVGGRLLIETANTQLDQQFAGEHDLPPGDYVSLCVSDNGSGMPPEIVAKVFEPFFTTKPLGQGTGLGLSMVYGFVRQSGGQVQIRSKPGDGTSVCLYLPRHNRQAEGPRKATGLADAPRAAGVKTVLVVDDELSVRQVVSEVLQELGYQTIEAADGASGLRVLQSEARIDLVVTDVGLPGGMNGRQMVDAARVGRPDLGVLFITGYAETAIVGDNQLETGMRVMVKPFAMEALASQIRDLTALQPG